MRLIVFVFLVFPGLVQGQWWWTKADRDVSLSFVQTNVPDGMVLFYSTNFENAVDSVSDYMGGIGMDHFQFSEGAGSDWSIVDSVSFVPGGKAVRQTSPLLNFGRRQEFIMFPEIYDPSFTPEDFYVSVQIYFSPDFDLQGEVEIVDLMVNTDAASVVQFQPKTHCFMRGVGSPGEYSFELTRRPEASPSEPIELYARDTIPVNLGGWNQIEWHASHATNGFAKLWVNGTFIGEFENQDTKGTGSADEIQIAPLKVYGGGVPGSPNTEETIVMYLGNVDIWISGN